MHPRWLIDDTARLILRFYHLLRPAGGLAAPALLPFAGGLADQPAYVMAAIDALAVLEARVRDFEKGNRDG